jgi:MFS family permease
MFIKIFAHLSNSNEERKALRFVFIIHSLEGLASALIGIFIPIYFLSLGFSLVQVFLYMIVYSFGVLIFFILAGALSARIGLRTLLFLRLPFLILFLGLLYFFKSFPVSIYLIAIIASIHITLYWFPMNVLFAKKADAINLGSDVGKLFAFPKVAGIFAPILGAIIVNFFGFSALFLIGIIIYLFMTIPIIYITNFKPTIEFHPKKIIHFFQKYPKLFWVTVVENIREEMEEIIILVFLYVLFHNILTIGLVSGLLQVGSVLFALFIGNLTDKKDRKKILKIGALIGIFIWTIRFFVNSEILFYILSISAGFFSILILIPFNFFTTKITKENNIDEFVIYCEIPILLGRVIIYSICILLVSNLKLSFLVTAASLLAFLFY